LKKGLSHITDESSTSLEVWEEELLAQHRWGQHGDRAVRELSKLRKLWDSIQPVDDSTKGIAFQIASLEICNWNLEESILTLCRAIGNKRPSEMGIGHGASMTEDRWREIWAYYCALRNWLPSPIGNGYGLLLREYDSDRAIQDHVADLLGDRNELKELYVMRLCLCLDYWLGGCHKREQYSSQKTAHTGAVTAVEQEIKQRDHDNDILSVFQLEGDGKLNPCHHKLFRRLDIIISSIGVGRLFGAMPMRGTDGYDRADLLETYLSPIELWLNNRGQDRMNKGVSGAIISSLGERDDTAVFLASLLVSLLRSQQIAARQRAESRFKKAAS